MNLNGQLERFNKLGIVDDIFEEIAEEIPLTNPYDESEPLELRARSWLHANCSHCHKVSGGSGLTAQMNAAVPNSKLELINYQPTKGYFGLEGAPEIDPGDPYNSVLYYRIATRGAGHMPMVGVRTVDQEGVRLIHDWIRSMDPEKSVPKVSTQPQNVKEALALYHAIQSGDLSEEDAKQAVANCMKSTDPFVINLFALFEFN
jgi:mono/diheme cytochrome c family protein